MSKLQCVIRLGEVPLHLYHLVSGFTLLHRQGIIELKVERLGKGHPDLLPYNMMEAQIQGMRLVYDVNDGYDNLLAPGQDYAQLMDPLLERYDAYFKRSFCSRRNAKLQYGAKMLPLGLNFMVTVPGSSAHLPTSGDARKEKIKKLVRMLPFTEHYNGHYYMGAFEEAPNRDTRPDILFMVRMWDVDGDYAGQLSPAKKEERAYINEFRAKCIRLCRREFGPAFFGGASRSDFASRRYPDLVIEDRSLTKRNHYMKRVKQSAICIATMGLHESIGWKFAEYVAASRAIVTEELRYEVPGGFAEGCNYVSFRTPEECAGKIHMLRNDDEYRYRMMVNNYNYYHNYVRPDRQVLCSLLSVLEDRRYGAVQLKRGLG